MNAADFSTLLREWRADHGFSDPEAAAALGCRYGTFTHWLNGHCLPKPLTLAAMLRQMRDGRDPLVDVCMGPAEFGALVSDWRLRLGLTQRQAGIALGVVRDTLGDWEQQMNVPQQPALAEVLRRLRVPVDVEAVQAASKRPPVIAPQDFAAALRKWRRRHQLTQTQAGRVLHTTGRTIWVWEAARSLPKRPFAVLAQLRQPAPKPAKPTPLIEPRRFAALLRRWRRGHRLTQAQACAALGLPADAALISDYERGDAMPQPARLRAILDAIASRPAPPPPPRIRPSPFARGLRKWRKFRRLTLAQAAAILGCTVPMICKYEHGRNEPPPQRMAAILAIIDA